MPLPAVCSLLAAPVEPPAPAGTAATGFGLTAGAAAGPGLAAGGAPRNSGGVSSPAASVPGGALHAAASNSDATARAGERARERDGEPTNMTSHTTTRRGSPAAPSVCERGQAGRSRSSLALADRGHATRCAPNPELRDVFPPCRTEQLRNGSRRSQGQSPVCVAAPHQRPVFPRRSSPRPERSEGLGGPGARRAGGRALAPSAPAPARPRGASPRGSRAHGASRRRRSPAGTRSRTPRLSAARAAARCARRWPGSNARAPRGAGARAARARRCSLARR